MKTALIQFTTGFVKGDEETNPDSVLFPLALGYISTVLKSNKIDYDVVDLSFEERDYKKMKQKLDQYDVLCFSTMIGPSLAIILEMIDNFKDENNIIIVGGPMASSTPISFLKETKTDIVVIGEGEETIVDLLNSLESMGDLHQVNGIMFRYKEGVVRTIRTNKVDLEKYPFPDWDSFNTDKYIIEDTASIISSRGCPFGCKFCSHIGGRLWYARSAESVIEEAKELKRRFGIKRIKFEDDNFLHSSTRAITITKALKELGITWTCQARADSITDDIVKELTDNGCEIIRLGLESGSDRMLRIMNKGITLQQTTDAIKVLDKHGLRIRGGFILGMPQERLSDALASIKYSRWIFNTTKQRPIIFFPMFLPYPSSEWCDYTVDKGYAPLSLKEWAHYSQRGGFVFNPSEMSNTTLKFVYYLANLSLFFSRGFFSRTFGIIKSPSRMIDLFNRIQLKKPT